MIETNENKKATPKKRVAKKKKPPKGLETFVDDVDDLADFELLGLGPVEKEQLKLLKAKRREGEAKAQKARLSVEEYKGTLINKKLIFHDFETACLMLSNQLGHEFQSQTRNILFTVLGNTEQALMLEKEIISLVDSALANFEKSLEKAAARERTDSDQEEIRETLN